MLFDDALLPDELGWYTTASLLPPFHAPLLSPLINTCLLFWKTHFLASAGGHERIIIILPAASPYTIKPFFSYFLGALLIPRSLNIYRAPVPECSIPQRTTCPIMCDPETSHSYLKSQLLAAIIIKKKRKRKKKELWRQIKENG